MTNYASAASAFLSSRCLAAGGTWDDSLGASQGALFLSADGRTNLWVLQIIPDHLQINPLKHHMGAKLSASDSARHNKSSVQYVNV